MTAYKSNVSRVTALSFLLGVVTILTSAQPAHAQSFTVNDTAPAIERWMYPFNSAPCNRPAGSIFGTLGDEAGVDSRHGQHLVGWDTQSLVATNQGAAYYLIRSCRLTLTINRGGFFQFDPTQDSYRTYFEANQPGYEPDTDVGRPIELFGVGFRNNFTVFTYEQCSAFGGFSAGGRNAYAAGWSTNGTLVDVGNNVGKTNVLFPSFEVAPFAIGQAAEVTVGEFVPTAAKITFDLNLADPLVLTYVQRALDQGRLRFMVTSLHGTEGQTGQQTYPDFVTHFNEAVFDPSRIEITGTVVSDTDTDTDELPDDWEQFYFESLTPTATDDPDADGANNLAEHQAGTHPLQGDSVLQILSIDGHAGEIHLRFTHAASRQYVIESTEDFVTWTPLADAPVYELGTGIAEWKDAAPTAQRFYRLRAQIE